MKDFCIEHLSMHVVVEHCRQNSEFDVSYLHLHCIEAKLGILHTQKKVALRTGTGPPVRVKAEVFTLISTFENLLKETIHFE